MDTPRKQFLPEIFTSTHLYHEQFVCEAHYANLTCRMTQKHFHLSLRRETRTCQRGLKGTAAEETFTPSRCSLHFSPPLALSFLPHLSSREKFIWDEGRNHLQVCTEDHVPAEIRTCTKRSSPSNKVTSIQRSIKYLWAGNPLLIIHF